VREDLSPLMGEELLQLQLPRAEAEKVILVKLDARVLADEMRASVSDSVVAAQGLFMVN
jgi:hypothetical protein